MPGTLYTNTQKYAPPCCPRTECLERFETVPAASVSAELLAEAQPYESPFVPPPSSTTGRQSPQAKRRPS